MREPGERRLTPYKAALSRKVECLRGLLTTGRTKGIEWAHRGGTRVRAWGSAGSGRVHRWGNTGRAATRNGVQRGLAFLTRHPVGLKTIVGLLVLAVALLALWKIPQWQVADPTLSAKDRLELQDKARGTLAQIIGGMVVLVGLYFTGRSAAAAWRNVQVAHEGQITERFTRAIEQLGSDKLAIRLGGIYALERIARDSAPDYWPIMEVLTAYVRENALWKGSQPQLKNERSASEDSTPKLAADIQAILTVIGRQTPRDIREDEEQILDLRGTDLRKAALHHAYLRGANLADAHLEGATLLGAHLEGAMLVETHLERAILVHAHLEGAMLNSAYLEWATLYKAHLEGAYLGGAHLEGAVLQQAHLEGATLWGATGLTKEEIASAMTDEETILPFDLPSLRDG
jgi:hypothetical protein